eukprot:g18788.t1
MIECETVRRSSLNYTDDETSTLLLASESRNRIPGPSQIQLPSVIIYFIKNLKFQFNLNPTVENSSDMQKSDSQFVP